MRPVPSCYMMIQTVVSPNGLTGMEDPGEMKSRKENRFPDHDYSRQGYYFVTICTRNHTSCFGKVLDGRMRLDISGMIAQKCWLAIPGHFPNSDLDEYIVMPNHIHGIVIIGGDNYSGRDAYMRPLQSKRQNIDRSKMYLSKIIQGFKSSVTRKVRKRRGNNAFGWQRSFYDHVIRNEEDLNHIREYIHNNPLKWALDRYNPAPRP